MFKPYLKSIVRNGGKGRMGLGIELFRLDAVEESALTEEEAEVAEESNDEPATTAVMRVYEDIGEDFWTGGGVTAKKFSEELNSFGPIKRLNVHINSLGGDVFTAQAIYSILCDHDSKKTAYIDGICASAATLIACGADEVIARHNTNYMVHYPWSLAIGNAKVMRKAADDLDNVTVPILNVYKAQIGDKISEERIRELMEEETWMTADEALENGFVDKVRGKIKAIARVGKSRIMCSGRLMDVGRYHYRNVPDYPMAKTKVSTESKTQPKGIIMTREEVDPTLVTEIENNARTAERARLAALDEMSGPGLEEIIAKAKADGKQPQDIAMECLKITKAKLNSTTVINALKNDAAAAGGVKAGDAPSKKPPTAAERGAKLIAGAFQAQRPRAAVQTNGN